MSLLAAFVTAFFAGIVSFLSPCVLPLVPAYLSFMTGLNSRELANGVSRTRVLAPALMFVLGFTLVFVAMGATASVLGQALMQYRGMIGRASGVVVIAFGVLMLGVIKLPWLYGEARVDMERSRAFGKGAALVMGAAFAAGWTPCIGPILGSILTLAASTATVARGALLLAVYSLGLGLPFVLVALLFGRLQGALAWMNRHSLVISRAAGSILIVVGILMVTGRFGSVVGWFTRVIPAIEIPLRTF